MRRTPSEARLLELGSGLLGVVVDDFSEEFLALLPLEIAIVLMGLGGI